MTIFILFYSDAEKLQHINERPFEQMFRVENMEEWGAVGLAYRTFGPRLYAFSATLQHPNLPHININSLFQPKGLGGSLQSPHNTK